MSSEHEFELYKKYRPRKFSELKGQEAAVRTLTAMGKKGKFPHFILLSGESGTGKTTIARILGKCLGCAETDFVELNCAGEARGIDTIREIDDEMRKVPLWGSVRVYVLDESHRLTQDAQAALLKMLEDTPEHVYFILATTDPQKLTKTIHTRATHIQLKALSDKDMADLVREVSEKEGFSLSDDVCDKIVKVAEGSPRKALVILNQILYVSGEKEQLEVVGRAAESSKSIDLARRLFDHKSRWKDIAAILKELDDDPEVVRRTVLGYAQSVLLSGGPLAGRAADVIYNFREPTFYTGKPGISRACWDSMKES